MTFSSKPPLERFLARLQAHSVLSGAEQDAVLQLDGVPADLPAKQDIVIPGQTVRHSILTVDGVLGRFDLMRNGARQITAIHIAGDMCDLHASVAPTTGWGITALSNAVVMPIAHEDIRRLVVRHPRLALVFWRDTALDASILAKWVANVGRKDARARLAHLFCELGMRIEAADLGTRHAYFLPMTQEQIGDAVGLTPVHVNRTLQWLRIEGLITRKGQMVTIDRWEALASLAEFNPNFLLPVEIAELSAPLDGESSQVA